MPIDMSKFEAYKASQLAQSNIPNIDMSKFEAYKAMMAGQTQGPVDAYGRPIARAEVMREPYPSEKFSNIAEPISQFGGMFAKTPGMGTAIAGASTMGAEIAKQGIQAYNSEPGTPTNTLESGRRIGQAFLRGATGEALGRGVFSGVAKVAPKLIEPAAQAMKVSAGIPEQTGKRVLGNPQMLSRAKSVEEAGQTYADALNATGLQQGPEATMKIMGKSALSQEGATGFAYDALNKLKEGNLSYQEALVARDQIKNILKMPKWQNPSIAQNERFLISMRDQLDAYLEPYFQEAGQSFANARTGYSEAMAKKDFSSWLPTNANKTASVLRGTLAATAAGAGLGGYVSPETALAGIGLASPRVLGYGIRTMASPITREVAKFGTRLGMQAIANQAFPSSTEELMRKYYEAQK